MGVFENFDGFNVENAGEKATRGTSRNWRVMTAAVASELPVRSHLPTHQQLQKRMSK